MKAAARLLLIVTLMVSIGAHWGVLQVVAWAQMLKSYAAEKGLVQGLQETFNGEHPCEMCQKIAETKKHTGEQAPIPQERTELMSKWLSLPAGTIITAAVRCKILPNHMPGELQLGSSQWQTTPPTPPPRCGV
ncbi:MAG TPA: hypothetical protein VLE43_06770 [Candidatus Saccharimonadia bacterium]|nr:hypothetical protein [Candidatus Saccharimonadia bacterium]